MTPAAISMRELAYRHRRTMRESRLDTETLASVHAASPATFELIINRRMRGVPATGNPEHHLGFAGHHSTIRNH